MQIFPTIKPTYVVAPDAPSTPQNDIEMFHKYPRFTILVSYDPEAFQRSHRIEFFLPQERKTQKRHAQNEAVIDSVACLKRTDSSRCANCIGQQKAGKRRVGRITINPIVLVYLLERHNLNNEDATEKEIVDCLKKSFKSRAVDAGRRTLAGVGKMVMDRRASLARIQLRCLNSDFYRRCIPDSAIRHTTLFSTVTIRTMNFLTMCGSTWAKLLSNSFFLSSNLLSYLPNKFFSM
jgi:hypothetical protein